MEIFPEPLPAGTLVVMVVGVAVLTGEDAILTITLLLARVG